MPLPLAPGEYGGWLKALIANLKGGRVCHQYHMLCRTGGVSAAGIAGLEIDSRAIGVLEICMRV